MSDRIYISDLGVEVIDPVEMTRVFWPAPDNEYLTCGMWDKQVELMYSVEYNAETYAVSANQMGKDWIAARIVLLNFLRHPVARIVLTSVKDDHLRVLWDEMMNFITQSKLPLTSDKGGPLRVFHREIRRVGCDKSYILRQVSERGEGLAGHHAPYTLGVGDEASALDDQVQDQMRGWAKRLLFFGNPNPCHNFFRRECEKGDMVAA